MPPAARKLTWPGEMELTAPAMPTVSFGRFHDAPLIDRPPETLEIDVGEGQDLAAAVVPAEAEEGADIVGDLLVDAEVDAILGAGLPGEGDGRVGCRRRVAESATASA